jgi:hypothetical protein
MPTKMSKIDQFASYNDRQREKYSSERSWKRGSEMRGNGGTIVRSILRSLVLVVTLMSENANGYAPSISRSTTLIRSKRIERVRLFSSSPQTSSMPTSRSVPSKIDKAEKCGPVDPDRRALPFGLDSLIKMFTTEDEEYATFGLASSIPSDQPQLPVLERLAKVSTTGSYRVLFILFSLPMIVLNCDSNVINIISKDNFTVIFLGFL